MAAEHLIGVDLGTSVVKTTLFDLAGHALADATRDTVLHQPGPCLAEQNADDFHQAALDTIREMVEKSHVRPPGDVPLIRHRPFRAPHYTISHAGLVGGGQWPRPGEISLAHRGVLFLDEMPEFGPHGLEVLRQPLEDRTVTISRAQGSLTFPANFMLVGAQNPCPYGFAGDPEHPCMCSPMLISRYQKRLSGPLLDHIDVHWRCRMSRFRSSVTSAAASHRRHSGRGDQPGSPTSEMARVPA